MILERRGALGIVLTGLAELALGCSSTPGPKTAKAPLPPLATDKLAGLATGAGLEWIVLTRPREIAAVPFLIPEIGVFASEQSLDAFAKDTGIDLREIPEAVVARYDETLGGADLQLVRHHGDPGAVEQGFDKRLTQQPLRTEDRPDVVRVSGVIGTKPHAFARLGQDVVAFQEDGSIEKGPLRVAALYAEGKLKKTPRALDTEPLRSLAARFGDAPLIALAKGPFVDEWKRAAKGLLEAATAVGGAVRPTARDHIGIAVAITGDFHGTGAKASDVLMDALADLASTEMGHLLGLDRPIEDPIPTHTDEAVALSIELDPHRFAAGLHALVSEDVDAIMKL
jgi:hypothetical protein